MAARSGVAGCRRVARAVACTRCLPVVSIVLAVLLGIAQTAQPDETDHQFALVRVMFDPAITDRVGARRAGALCLPAGAIRWRDAKPDAQAAREAMLQRLHAVDPANVYRNPVFERLPDTRFRLAATVTAVHIDGCEKRWMLPMLARGPAAVDGIVGVTVRWQVFDRDDRAVIAERSVVSTYRFAHARELDTDATIPALADNAERFWQDVRATLPR